MFTCTCRAFFLRCTANAQLWETVSVDSLSSRKPPQRLASQFARWFFRRPASCTRRLSFIAVGLASEADFPGKKLIRLVEWPLSRTDGSLVSLRLALHNQTVRALLRVRPQGLRHLELLLPGGHTTIPKAFSGLSALTSLICTDH